MNYKNDNRTVMTLDAGGTNFVFSAIQGMENIVEPVRLPSNADNLERCLATLIEGFTKVKEFLKDQPVAISFAFPGPADYPNGIIGDLGNLPAFRGGIALGPMLKENFGIPVFINNDGDLFVYGEAIAGFLPSVNEKLEKAGISKRYKNLFGITLGTGFGGGFVADGKLHLGDNSCGGEIWITRNKVNPDCFAEEGASIRAVQRVYMSETGINIDNPPSPKEIFDIASGNLNGNRKAAIKAFEEMGEVVGDSLANAITIIDGLIVIGGGLTGAASYILPAIVKEMNGAIHSLNGDKLPRLPIKVYNLEDEKEFNDFLKGEERQIQVPGTDKTIPYDPLKRIGIGLNKLDTSEAVSIGAYAFALSKLD
jgi:glucokinase